MVPLLITPLELKLPYSLILSIEYHNMANHPHDKVPGSSFPINEISSLIERITLKA